MSSERVSCILSSVSSILSSHFTPLDHFYEALTTDNIVSIVWC
jgi:hypothetical protein